MPFLISAPSLNSRFTQLFVAALFFIGVIWFWVPSVETARHLKVPGLGGGYTRPKFPVAHNDAPPKPNHPIDKLVQDARKEVEDLDANASKDIHHAAEAYRQRRGRQPPPGFDEWFKYAQDHDALIVEDFFDQIYNDINPFWGVPAKTIREQAWDFEFVIRVRDHNTTIKSDGNDRPWMVLWSDMVSTIQEHLPDVDMPINVMDESRMVVPWEEINDYMAKDLASREIVSSAELKTTYQSLKSVDNNPPEHFDPQFSNNAYWPLYVDGCPPDSPAKHAYIDADFTTSPPISPMQPEGSYHGYVKNWTFTTSPCFNPHLQGIHGSFVEPVSISNTKRFFPLFGGSKLPMNNEILLPPAMYWTTNPFYSGGDDHGIEWSKKYTGVIWRGAASGGRNQASNWKRFQRHRFLSMVNGTSVALAETHPEPPPVNFVLPTNNTYDLAAWHPTSTPGSLGKWVSDWSDSAPVNLLCFPNEGHDGHVCSYDDAYISTRKSKKMKEQYSYKYLPDIDGNSFSGRYRGFLGSTSMPIKATIYKEWHDSRLVPWQHFAPMDNTFIDIYGLMEYFLGNADAGVGGHDKVAEEIAMGGKVWTEKVLRREDMQIYVYRLILEYARVCDDDRLKMGFREPGKEGVKEPAEESAKESAKDSAEKLEKEAAKEAAKLAESAKEAP